MEAGCRNLDSLNESVVKGHNLTPAVSTEPEENGASCERKLPETPTFESSCKKHCTDALLHSSLERMRRERIKDCCDQLRVLLPYVKGRRTDVASILEMTVEYMRYIYGRIPNNVMSQILEIFQTNSRYCKYVWKAHDHKYPQNQLTPRRNVFTSNSSSEKIKPKIQYAPYQFTGNEYFNNHKTDDASTMNSTFVYPKAAFESNQYYVPATKRLVPQLQTSLSPNIPPPSVISIPYDVQNICLTNLANSSIFLSTGRPSGSVPVFTPWASDVARSCIAPSPLPFSSDCLNSLSSLHSGYSVNPYSVMSTSVTQTVNTSSSPAMTFTSISHALTNFPAKPPTTTWTTSGEQRGTEARENVCNVID
ncbi:uncharacterized protein LOC127575740 isoform X2 [Pristis pectinata]|uniref:uncharacterized protein LOC127575740 isoform X2 n=1 Tax=Pristis pectinata TaxID=685728 RepID=UPI00223D4681|nr:uncharacterized protein LOC127575740 isoform X2 [Pristis pectinata]